MILLELKNYIRQHRQVSAENLKNRFDLSGDALEGLMRPLLQQGFVYCQHSSAQTCAGQCLSGCLSASAGEHYYWSEQPLKPLSINIVVNQ